MLSAFTQIPWLAVLAGTAVFAVLGGIYFAGLFSKQYLYVTGRENLPQDQAKQPMSPIFIVGPLVCSLINVIADAFLIQALGIHTVSGAIALGLIVALGFLIPMAFNIAINPLFPRPLQYGLLNAPYFLIANVLACVLLVLIPW